MPIKILLTKIGIDGHDRGVRVIAYILREAGMEVIYTGPWQKIEAVTEVAKQEDVDIIGISTLGGDHVLVPKLIKHLRENGVNTPVIVGGVIPHEADDVLKKAGVCEIVHSGSSSESIIQSIRSQVKRQGAY